MATPITHIVIAARLYGSYFADRDPTAFYVGTSFPDIRKSAKLDRNGTHVFNLAAPQILGATEAFETGRLLHCLLDETRDRAVKQAGLEELTGSSQGVKIIKFLEDELLYSEVDDWERFRSYFATIPAAERSFGASDGQIKAYHGALEAYLAAPPTDVSRAALLQNLNASPETITATNAGVARFRADPSLSAQVHQTIEQVAAELERILQKQ